MEDKITVFNVKSYDSFWGDDAPFKTHFEEAEMKIDFGYDLEGEIEAEDPGVINVYKYDEKIIPDVVILYDRVNTLKCWKKLKEIGLLDRTAFLLNESGAVDWKCGSFFLKHFQNAFPLFLTYRDDYVNGDDILKTYVVGYKIKAVEQSDKAYDERSLLCLICAKKKSHFRHEMYSERLKNIKFFEEHPEIEFDLYGAWWGDRFKTWRGMIPNKREAYHNHKFALCIENSNEPGYITEKIFDCFRFGIVPIYAGPENVGDYLPKGSYIDYYMFDDPSRMVEYLQDITEEEHNAYLEAAREYITSDRPDIMYDKREILKKCITLLDKNSKDISRSQVETVALIDASIAFVRKMIDTAARIKNYRRQK